MEKVEWQKERHISSEEYPTASTECVVSSADLTCQEAKYYHDQMGIESAQIVQVWSFSSKGDKEVARKRMRGMTQGGISRTWESEDHQ